MTPRIVELPGSRGRVRRRRQKGQYWALNGQDMPELQQVARSSYGCSPAVKTRSALPAQPAIAEILAIRF